MCVMNTHSELVVCLSFNADGSLLATACKDKKIRIIEPRTGRVLQVCVCVFMMTDDEDMNFICDAPPIQESRCGSRKVSRILFLWDLKMLVSTGNSCWNQRQFALWDLVTHTLMFSVVCVCVFSGCVIWCVCLSAGGSVRAVTGGGFGWRFGGHFPVL